MQTVSENGKACIEIRVFGSYGGIPIGRRKRRWRRGSKLAAVSVIAVVSLLSSFILVIHELATAAPKERRTIIIEMCVGDALNNIGIATDTHDK